MIDWQEKQMPYGYWADAEVGPIMLTVRELYRGKSFQWDVLGASRAEEYGPATLSRGVCMSPPEARAAAEASAKELLQKGLALF